MRKITGRRFGSAISPSALPLQTANSPSPILGGRVAADNERPALAVVFIRDNPISGVHRGESRRSVDR
jgi:hypothetical protein